MNLQIVQESDTLSSSTTLPGTSHSLDIWFALIAPIVLQNLKFSIPKDDQASFGAFAICHFVDNTYVQSVHV